MNQTRFDTITRLFASRRSRREAMLQGGAGLVAGTLAATGLNHAFAQGATPMASPAASTPASTREFLFLQSFESGTIAPKDGADGTYSLTLHHGLGQTIYFSDRPERIVGAAPTQQFLDGLGFSADNPPNAALVVDTADGSVDIAVVELTNPTYDTASSTATYDISVLKDYAEVDLQFQETTGDPAALAAEFGSAHLFIDDCPDKTINCYQEDGTFRGYGPVAGTCWNWSTWSCNWCDEVGAASACNTLFPECNNQCVGEQSQ